MRAAPLARTRRTGSCRTGSCRPGSCRPGSCRPGSCGSRKHRQVATRDRGSGSILAVAILGALFAVTAVLVPVLALLPAKQSVQGAADAAALAAADTASGLMPGVPCEMAALAAELNAARLVGCTVDGLTATVTVVATAGIFPIGARARAGPAP